MCTSGNISSDGSEGTVAASCVSSHLWFNIFKPAWTLQADWEFSRPVLNVDNLYPLRVCVRVCVFSKSQQRHLPNEYTLIYSDFQCVIAPDLHRRQFAEYAISSLILLGLNSCIDSIIFIFYFNYCWYECSLLKLYSTYSRTKITQNSCTNKTTNRQQSTENVKISNIIFLINMVLVKRKPYMLNVFMNVVLFAKINQTWTSVMSITLVTELIYSIFIKRNEIQKRCKDVNNINAGRKK